MLGEESGDDAGLVRGLLRAGYDIHVRCRRAVGFDGDQCSIQKVGIVTCVYVCV